ncbi:hypothetical protein KKG38_00200 [Patescibacteria group bacterium]|nr:hypothetical protein [Patescibacteria group bacterium]
MEDLNRLFPKLIQDAWEYCIQDGIDFRPEYIRGCEFFQFVQWSGVFYINGSVDKLVVARTSAMFSLVIGESNGELLAKKGEVRVLQVLQSIDDDWAREVLSLMTLMLAALREHVIALCGGEIDMARDLIYLP